MKFKCPHCEAKLKAPPNKAGKIANCPRCKNRIRMPGKKDAVPSKGSSASEVSHSSAPPVAQPNPKAEQPKAEQPKDHPLESQSDIESLVPPESPPNILADTNVDTSAQLQPGAPAKRKLKNPYRVFFVTFLGATAAVAVISIGLYFLLFANSTDNEVIPETPVELVHLKFAPNTGATHVYDIVFTTESPRARRVFSLEYSLLEEVEGGKKVAFKIVKTDSSVPRPSDPFQFLDRGEKEGEFVLTESGASTGLTNTFDLPFWLGPIVRSPLIVLPPTPEREWRNLFGMSVSVPDFSGHPTSREASYESLFTVQDQNSQTVTINETKTVSPVDPTDDSFAMSATGKHIFSRSLKLLESSEFEGTFKIGRADDKLSVKFQLNCQKR